jgi:hypothetical protein
VDVGSVRRRTANGAVNWHPDSPRLAQLVKAGAEAQTAPVPPVQHLFGSGADRRGPGRWPPPQILVPVKGSFSAWRNPASRYLADRRASNGQDHRAALGSGVHSFDEFRAPRGSGAWCRTPCWSWDGAWCSHSSTSRRTSSAEDTTMLSGRREMSAVLLTLARKPPGPWCSRQNLTTRTPCGAVAAPLASISSEWGIFGSIRDIGTPLDGMRTPTP